MQDLTFAFTLLFCAALLLGVLAKLYLSARQVKHVAQHRAQVPAAFASTVTLQAHQKAADYTLAKAKLGMLELALGTAVLLGWTLLGGLDALNQLIQSASWAANKIECPTEGDGGEERCNARRLAHANADHVIKAAAM